MKHLLCNKNLTVEIDSLGAELQSIRDEEGRDYLWNGDKTYWARRSPILFPFIGRLKESKYRYKDVEYQSEPHGFARDMEFSLVEKTDTSLWLEICDTEEIYKIYPFHFSLRIGYELVENTVKVSWKVKNLSSSENMYFSIGAHPGFFCPFQNEGEDKGGYFLELKGGGDELTYHFANLDTGLVIDKPHDMKLTDGKIQITKEFFDESTYLFLNHQVNEVSLLRPNGQKYVSVAFDMPILAIWSPEKQNAPFICLEPWYGCCDGEWFEGSLEERDWGNRLEALEEFANTYTITVG